MQDFYIPVDEEEGKIFKPDRRLERIDLKPSNSQSYSIGAIGKYLYNEKLISVKTEGKIIAIVNSDPVIPTRLVYFGNYNPLSDTGSSSINPQAESSNSGRIEGYLVDDLDWENKNNNRLHFLGPIG